MSTKNKYKWRFTLMLSKGFCPSILLVVILLTALCTKAQTPVKVSEGNSHGNFTDQDRIVKLNTSGTNGILFSSNDEFLGWELWKYHESSANSKILTI